MVVQVSDDGWDEIYVYLIKDDDQIEAYGVFDNRAKAEREAARVAKVCGCEWECNY